VTQSSINGSGAPLEAAIAEAARLIGQSRSPLIAGLGTDVAGARAAIGLAERTGAVLDHMHSRALLRDLAVMREYGMMSTTPNEARTRADVVLLVGEGLDEAGLASLWPDLRTRQLAPPAGKLGPRRVFWLCPGKAGRAGLAASAPEGGVIEGLAGAADDLPEALAALRARANGRATGLTGARLRTCDGLASALQAAAFGVVVWSSAQIDALAIEMLCGLVKDLNAKTRCSGLPLAPPDNGAGVLQVCGWMTGFPMRTGFARGFPEHDPWRFDAQRLVDSGEADCALWISSFSAATPGWKRTIPLIALAPADAKFAAAPAVRIGVGEPGVDHDGVAYFARSGTLAPLPASRPSEAPSVASVLERIGAALEAGAGGAPC